MPVVKIEPTNQHRTPYIREDERASTDVEQLQVLSNTAELLVSLGAELETDEETAKSQAKLLDEAIKNKKISNVTNINTAYAAAAFLKTYGSALALDVASARAAITNKLMEIANCGDPKYELKALELLGKHSDIGIFTERSEITINYKNPEDLENAIKERVKRLLNADVLDITPISQNLDEELGFPDLPDKNTPEDGENQ